MVVGKTIGWALPVAALLAACGGGGGTDVDGGGGGGPGLAIPTWSQRIEPFEPKAAALKGAAQDSVVSRAVAQAGATRVIALAPLQGVTPKRAAAAGSAGAPRQIGTARAVAETADAATAVVATSVLVLAADTTGAGSAAAIPGFSGVSLTTGLATGTVATVVSTADSALGDSLITRPDVELVRAGKAMPPRRTTCWACASLSLWICASVGKFSREPLYNPLRRPPANA